MSATPPNRVDPNDVRDGEKPRTWYRSERIYLGTKGWYIQTREGIDVGPFSCRFDAETDADLLVRNLSRAQPERALNVIHNQQIEVYAGSRPLNSSAFTSYLVEEGGVELLRRESKV